jgi:hypothetical protein
MGDKCPQQQPGLLCVDVPKGGFSGSYETIVRGDYTYLIHGCGTSHPDPKLGPARLIVDDPTAVPPKR